MAETPRFAARADLLTEEFSGRALNSSPNFFAISITRGMSCSGYGLSAPIYFCGRTGTNPCLVNTALIFWEDQPVGWVDARFRRTGVELTLHAIAGNRAQDGQTSRITWT